MNKNKQVFKAYKHKAAQLLCFFLALLLLSSVLSLSAYAGSENLEAQIMAVCDINGDRNINANDARLLLRHSASLYNLSITPAAKTNGVRVFGDLNGDRKINATDARILLRITASLFDISDAIPLLIEKSYEEQPKPDPKPDPKPNPDLEKLLVQNKLLSPYEDHGLGRAEMIIMIDDYVESTPAHASDAKSQPDYSPLIKGTIDYVIDSKLFSDKLYYILESNRKVAWKSQAGSVVKDFDDIIYTELIEDGYIMPANKLKAMTSVVTENSTDLYIKSDWLIPINISLHPISYFTGYSSLSWNVKDFKAEYMDIDFYYTESALASFSFPEESLIREGEWIENSDNNIMTLRLHFREEGGFSGQDISLTDSGYIKISLKNKSKSIAGKLIVLDPGHGERDPGAVSLIDGETGEKWINLNVAEKAAEILRQRGAKVVLSRSDDSFLTLREREDISRENKPDIFVSIHCNSHTTTSPYGVETFYYYPYSMPLAGIIQKHIVSVYENTIYADRPEMDKIDKGINFYPFYVSRIEPCPAVLLELGYLSNESDFEAIINPKNQELFAQALADGITEYLGTTLPNINEEKPKDKNDEIAEQDENEEIDEKKEDEETSDIIIDENGTLPLG